MGSITKTKTWVDNDNVTYTDLNGNFDTIYNEFNGNIDDANIKSGAAIAASKLDTVVLTTTNTKTVSNKTLTKPTLNGSVQALTTDTDGTTVTFDMAASNLHSVTLGGNRTLAVSNVAAGQSFLITLAQDETGSHTVTWWDDIKWVGATEPTLTTTASRSDIFAFIYDGTNYYGSVVGLNYG
jgi:hypothetical protein